MQKLFLALFGIFVLVMGGTGCSHKKPKTDEDLINTARMDDSDFGSSDQGKAMGIKTVHFDYDSNLLTNEAKAILTENAKILQSHPQVKIQIEGNCDNRGGIQYNLALGEKRAHSAKLFLQDLGISKNRMSTISYGKEHPIAAGDSEKAYAQNRRANFVVTSK